MNSPLPEDIRGIDKGLRAPHSLLGIFDLRVRNSRAKISQSLRGTGIAPVAFFVQVT
jgi:hypothetical protein